MNRLIFYISIGLTLPVYCYSQNIDTNCNNIYNGYVIIVNQHKAQSPAHLEDFFFSFEIPELRLFCKPDYAERYINDGIYRHILFFDEWLYEDKNFTREFSSNNFSLYYMAPAFDSLLCDNYTAYSYKVVVVGYIDSQLGVKIAKKNRYADIQSAFQYLTDTTVILKIIHPNIIEIW